MPTFSDSRGAPHLLVHPDELVAYGYDATMGYRGAPAAVVLAETEAQVVEGLAAAVARGVPCLARGAGNEPVRFGRAARRRPGDRYESNAPHYGL